MGVLTIPQTRFTGRKVESYALNLQPFQNISMIKVRNPGSDQQDIIFFLKKQNKNRLQFSHVWPKSQQNHWK